MMMKNNILFSFFMLLTFTIFGQEAEIPKGQVLVQNVDLRIDENDNQYRVIHDVDIYVENDLSQNQQTGLIELLMVGDNGKTIGVLETLSFTRFGEKAFMTNKEEFYAYQDTSYKAKVELDQIKESKENIRRALTVAVYEKDASKVAALEKDYERLGEREEVIRDIFGDPEFKGYIKPVRQNWVYANTYAKYLTLLDGYNLNKDGLELLYNWVMYRAYEDKEIIFDLGSVRDYFVEKQPPIITGSFTKDSENCYVLGENQSMSITEDGLYTIGRQGLCSGRTNTNGDNFKILKGEVISTYGLDVSEDGTYSPFLEDFEIKIKGAFTITKGGDGQFMVFGISY